MNTKKRCSSRIINSLLRRGGTFAVLASVLVLFPMIAYGAAVDLAWDANTEPDLAGYRIYYRTASGVYSDSDSVDVGSEEAAAGRNPACGSPYDPFKTECCEYTLSLNPGTYYLAAKAYDLDGNESAYSAELVHTISPPDTTAPSVSITNPESGTTYTSARTVTITAAASDNVGVSKVEFYQNGVLRRSDTTSPYNHSWAITSADNRNHSWSAKAYDAAGNNKVSGAVSLTVNIPVPDTTAPSVSITNPASGTTYTSARTVTITAAASDNVGVSKVEFYQNGVLRRSDTTSPYNHSWAITSADNRNHSWSAKAYDAAGNNKVSGAVSLTVNIPVPDTTAPSVSITNPASGTTYTSARTVTITAAASDNVGVSKVEFYQNGVLRRSDTTSPYNHSWAITSAVNRNHSWSAKAYDAAGNNKVSGAVSLTVNIPVPDTTAPSVSITNPESGTTYTSARTVTITAAASDNVGVSKVEFYQNGVLRRSDTTSPYNHSWAITSAVNRNHSWSAKAYDAAGNNEVSDAVSLTVNIPVPDNTLTIEAEDMPIKTTRDDCVSISGGVNLCDNGYIAEDIDFSAGGTFSFEVMAKGSYAGGAWPIMEVRIDQTIVEKITVHSSSWTAYTSQANITPGTHEVAIAFINDYWKNSDDRNLYVDKVTITTENSPPTADAGDDQTVEEGDVVVLDGFNSSDPDDNITGYSWEQTDDGVKVDLTNPGKAEATFIAPAVGTEPEMLTFKLTVIDEEGLQDIDTCSVQVTKAVSEDRDGDGYPDDEDAFPDDKNEHLDTDRDGIGNNEDEDDDDDGMPDTWESKYGLDPLNKDDADDDPDGDGVSNYDEYYYFGTNPNNNEDNFEPYPPALIAPEDHEVSLTPLLETEEFDDPDINDVHSRTQWEIVRAEDEFIVFDVTTESSLTSLTVPRLILEYDTDYIWRVKFIDNHGGASDWSEAGSFTTEFSEEDSDGNGILDNQEVDDTLDLDKDGVADREQSDIKCVVTEDEEFKIGISIREAENAESIVSIQSETSDDTDLFLSNQSGPKFLAFGLIHFKLTVKEPGDTVSLTIYLSKAAYEDGVWYKYNPVNNEWVDYSDFIDFSDDRKMIYLTLRDGGFGDADGIENGVIVDPLALRTESDHSSGSDSFVEDIAGNLDPTGMCFISSTDSWSSERRAPSFWSGIRNRDLSIVFILMMIAYIGVEISLRIMRNRKIGLRTSLMEGWRNT